MVVHSGYVPFEYVKSWHIERSAAVWPDLLSAEKDFTIYIENVMMHLFGTDDFNSEFIKWIPEPGHGYTFQSGPCFSGAYITF